MRTTKTYSEAIRDKYLKDKESGTIRGEIYRLTPANIRKLCLNLINEELSKYDKMMLKNNFETNDFDDIRCKIKKYDIDKFKPICKFLKKENESIASHEALELIAVLINFNSRPYFNFRNKYTNKAFEKKLAENQNDINDEEQNTDSYISYETAIDLRQTIIKMKPENKKVFTWVSNASATNKMYYF
ncbi:hypothetical protein [Psychroserpens jangbogonensis]|uniref:hypothetical protein n=1 Tax=Psychroserpens jangbogonensis TaxID=1484460 RepID=UPI00053EAFA7|nr:hypothetical protein [Psychroserpens jangbogonensis]